MSLAKKVENFFVYDELVEWYNSEEGQATFKRCENQEYLERGRNQTIKMMHDHGMEIKEIAKICNLTEKEVEKIVE